MNSSKTNFIKLRQYTCVNPNNSEGIFKSESKSIVKLEIKTIYRTTDQFNKLVGKRGQFGPGNNQTRINNPKTDIWICHWEWDPFQVGVPGVGVQDPYELLKRGETIQGLNTLETVEVSRESSRSVRRLRNTSDGRHTWGGSGTGVWTSLENVRENSGVDIHQGRRGHGIRYLRFVQSWRSESRITVTVTE